jgi:copper chaperone NosL
MRIPAIVIILAVLCTASCAREAAERPAAIEFNRSHACSACGMIIVDFPGAKGQIHYENSRMDAFCSTLDMLTFYLQPDRPKNIAAIYVNDMARADWEHPKGYWTDAAKAFFIYGGDIMGPMGEAMVPFAQKKDAEDYIKKHGGRIVMLEQVTMEMLRPRMPSTTDNPDSKKISKKSK